MCTSTFVPGDPSPVERTITPLTRGPGRVCGAPGVRSALSDGPTAGQVTDVVPARSSQQGAVTLEKKTTKGSTKWQRRSSIRRTDWATT